MTNYKHQYEQMKLMVDKYQNEIVPGLRKLIAEREPVRHGRWIWKGDDKGWFCSECGGGCLLDTESDWFKSDGCPHCRAKMDGDKHDTEE